VNTIKEIEPRGDLKAAATLRYLKLNKALKIKKGALKAPVVGKARSTR